MKALVLFPVDSTFHFGWVSSIGLNFRRDWRIFLLCVICSVSYSNYFVQPQSQYDFGKVAFFVYFLPQKVKNSSVPPLVEQWEHFAAIGEELLLAGSRVLVASEIVGSFYLMKEIHWDCRKHLEDFANCMLSTVATRSAISQGFSWFCPPILIGGEDHAAMKLFHLFVDWLLEKGWVRDAEMEACRSEYHSFVQEQRQKGRTSTRSRLDIRNILTSGSSQVDCPLRCHL